MTPLGFIILVAVVGLVAGGVVILGDRRGMRAVLREMAARHGGKVVGHWLYYPRLRLTRDGREMTVGALASAGVAGHRGVGNVGTGGPVTYVDFEAPEAGTLRLRARSRQRSLQSLGDAALARDAVSTGDAAFDGAFLVEGEPAPAVRALLAPQRRAELAALGTPRADLKIAQGRLTLSVQGIVRESGACERLLAAAAGFSQQLRRLGNEAATGISPVRTRPVTG